MNKKIAWIIDSTAFVSEQLRHHPDVYVVPLTIHFGREQFQDNVDLTTEQLHARIRESETSATTSQPAPGTFAVLYEALKEHYDEAIAVHLSSPLSGTYESSKTGAGLANFPIRAIDSRSISGNITALVERGIALHERGMSVDEIVETLEEMKTRRRAYALIGKLDQLRKSGRVSGIQFFLGSLLHIKPVIRVSEEGLLVPDKKIRSEKRAFNYLRDLVLESRETIEDKLYIMHGNVEESALRLQQMIAEHLPDIPVEIGDLPSSLATHAGEGSLAILWYDKK